MTLTAGVSTHLPPTFNELAFESFLDARNDPEWVVELRRAAFDVYREKADAPLDPEEWKRVDLRTFRPERFAIPRDPETASNGSEPAAVATLMQDRGEFAGHVTHLNGRSTGSSLVDDLREQGVVFGDLADLVHDHRELIEPHLLSRAVDPHTDRFSAWHAAFWTGGTVLYVPRNIAVEAPLYSLIALAGGDVADFSHTLVVLEDGASATLLEETASADEDSAGLHVGAVELLLGKEARLRYTQLQNWNQKSWHFAHQAGRVEQNGFLQWTVGGLGAKLAHIHQDVALDGRGAEAEVNGVTFAVGRQLASYYTQQAHNAPDTRSDLLYKEVLRDRARVVWRGMIKVEPEAQQTDGYQRNDALLLSRDARVDSVPGLEIEADDVRCTHAATAGRVDEEEIFYCMCRGMTEFEAMHMIVGGFFHEVYDRIPIEGGRNNEAEDEPAGIVRTTLSEAVERKLGIGD